MAQKSEGLAPIAPRDDPKAQKSEGLAPIAPRDDPKVSPRERKGAKS